MSNVATLQVIRFKICAHLINAFLMLNAPRVNASIQATTDLVTALSRPTSGFSSELVASFAALGAHGDASAAEEEGWPETCIHMPRLITENASFCLIQKLLAPSLIFQLLI